MRFIQYIAEDEPHLAIIRTGETTEMIDLTLNFGFMDMMQFLRSGVSVEDFFVLLDELEWIPYHETWRLVAPITDPSKILCCLVNYRDMMQALGRAPTEEPSFVCKLPSSIVGPLEPIILHPCVERLDTQIELAVIMAKEARYVSMENAMDYVFGYTIGQDISARDWQTFRNEGQYLLSKSMDGFCPLGPTIVHKSAISDPYSLRLTSAINDNVLQNGNTADMYHHIDFLIHYLSQIITLKPGDIIMTGTPAGVGAQKCPQQYLKEHDVLTSEIEGIGKILNPVLKPKHDITITIRS